MRLDLPELCLVALVGPSGCGKSTLARRFFKPTEVLSSDTCRGWVSDDELDQTVSGEAFEVLYTIAAKRLALGKLTVVDATNVQKEARAEVVAMARRFHVLPVAIVLALPERVCHDRNAGRKDRVLPPHVIRNQHRMMRASLGSLAKEGFRKIYVLRSPEEVDAAGIVRTPLWTNKKHMTGPFDIIGDVHGCAEELLHLLTKLGYKRIAGFVPKNDTDKLWLRPGETELDGFQHPDGRTAIFLGDIVDRGPRVVDSLRIVRNMVVAGSALCVPGNHDVKLLRKLGGKNVQVKHGLAQTLAEIDALPNKEAFEKDLAAFLDSLVSHYVLDGGKLVVAHAGMKQEMQGRASGGVREFALYGETTGETDEFGLPVRYNWAADYRGPATVVYGHTPVPQPEWLNRTTCIDTGCVFGGSLTALRWPEREFVSVPAKQMYCEPSRPIAAPSQFTSQQDLDRVLDMDDVSGKRRVETKLRGAVQIRPENAAAALEVMSRFAVDPRWLVYLPPTMSPVATSLLPGFLEHPAEAFGYYREAGVERVICEEKHMGSRAVVIVCKTADAARTRFGIETGEIGVITTRTGRSFFSDATLEAAMLERVRDAVTASGLWDELATEWLVLDCELMPWSAKAQQLLKEQYAAVGAAGTASVNNAVELLEAVERRTPEATPILEAYRERQTAMTKFVTAYRHYCWPVNSLDDYKLAPFHLLASEGKLHTDKPHTWHMETLARLADGRMIIATPFRIVDLNSEDSVAEANAWWLSMTGTGGEGMVVKPFDFIVKNDRGLVQPAVKCRGREYLRIIYGPDYDSPVNLDRLRHRGLGRKRALALSEFALGVEALERFVNREPLRRVHECVFGVLALESEPVDPRL
ncbi:polynucleotide kinase-phosphatase [soil metagenome]